MSVSQSQVNDLQKELDRSRTKVRILEKLIALRCDIRDCSLSAQRRDVWKSPQGYNLAVSFQYSGSSFVVYGDDMENIRETAAFYAARRYNSVMKQSERTEDQTQIGRIVVDSDGRRVEVIGIEPMFYSSFPNETHYISDAGTFTVSEVKEMPDWDWFGDE
jgi:hypothetical protein